MPPRYILSVAFLLAGCSLGSDDDGNIVHGVDFDALFAPPRADEIAAVEADWSSRDVTGRNVEIVHEDRLIVENRAARIRVLGHDVGDVRHYGAVLSPEEDAVERRPVLIYLHGGEGGVNVAEEMGLLLAIAPEIVGDFVIVAPAFRSELLRIGSTVFRSDGPPSPWDRDVDDTLALLNAALEIEPTADEGRIGIVGFSRGAAVGLLAAIRDPRIDAVVEFFGPTDFFGPYVQEIVRGALRGDVRPLPGAQYLNETYIQPLKRREKTIDEIRIELLRRSAVAFADRLPALQIHHGTDDPVVPVEQAEVLINALQALGRTTDELDYHLYPGGVHFPLTLPGSTNRTLSFLERLRTPTDVPS